ncbi:MAG: lamin tail domain-containing protein [Patescibacteria group bacterium]
MKKFFILAVVLIGSFFVFTKVYSAIEVSDDTGDTSSTPPIEEPEESTSTVPIVITSTIWAQLKINEFVADPATGSEWVELYNPSSSSLDVTGGYICDSRNTTSTCKDIFGVVSSSSWLFIDLQTKSYLNNGGDAVILKNPDGEIVDRVIYGPELAAEKDQSVARKTDGVDTDDNSDWAITTEPTPGAANIILAPVVPEPPVVPVVIPASPQSAPVAEKKTVSSTTKTAKVTTKTEEKIGLMWKIKYDPKVRVGENVWFDASTTFDPRGGRIGFSWDFDEGKIVTGTVAQYIFVSSGPHNILISATSTAGTTDTKKLKVAVYPNDIFYGTGMAISEINPETDDEFIKIKNISTSTVNVSNWKLMYNNKIYEIPTGTLVVAGDELIFYKEITDFTLNNSKGEVELRLPDDILADAVEYSKKTADPATSTKKKIDIVVTSSILSVSLLEARGLDKDQNVKVNGIVSVLPGIFGSQYFYIFDKSAGIQIYQYKKDFPKLRVGDKISVSGITSEASGIKRIRIKDKNDIKILLAYGEASSSRFALDDLNEDALGNLVRVQGEITEIKSNFMYVDDGTSEAIVYFKQGAKIDKSKFKEGENAEVIGVLEQGKTDLQIWPRSQEDIKSLGLSQDLIKKQVVLEKAMEQNDDSSKYLLATGGGIAALLVGLGIVKMKKRKV